MGGTDNNWASTHCIAVHIHGEYRERTNDPMLNEASSFEIEPRAEIANLRYQRAATDVWSDKELPNKMPWDRQTPLALKNRRLLHVGS